jgi:lipopolysaccharide biosynthesis protein
MTSSQKDRLVRAALNEVSIVRRRFRLPSRDGPLVLGAQKPDVKVEGVDHLAGCDNPTRVAVIAHWAPDSKVSRSVAELTRILSAHEYCVVVVSTAEGAAPLQWPGPQPAGVTILRRPNAGYDFGSWATALDRYPVVAGADQVLLMNDSLAGPFEPIDHLLARFDDSRANVWGLTDTTQFGHHLQSYCLGFKKQTLREAPLARFWRGIRVESSRDDVIWRYEIGLSRLLHRERYTLDVAIPCSSVVREGQNPTIIGWRRLLDSGFPFVKRQLLRTPEGPKASAARRLARAVVPSEVAPALDQVREEIERRYGVDVDDWV